MRNSVSVTDPILKIKGSLRLSLTTHCDWKETVLNKISIYLSANNTSHDIASALFTSREFLKLTHKWYCPFQEEKWQKRLSVSAVSLEKSHPHAPEFLWNFIVNEFECLLYWLDCWKIRQIDSEAFLLKYKTNQL